MKRIWIPAGLVCLLAGGLVWAQDDVTTLKVDVDLVNILFSVRDKRGALIPNLEKTDVTIAEDGKQQTIKYFSKESNLPLTIGLLVDVSKSMEGLLEIEKQSAHTFFARMLKEKDMAFLISFGNETELVQDYTNSRRLLKTGLDSLQIRASASGYGPLGNGGAVPQSGRPKGTLLYDAVKLAADEKLRREVGRKVIILITDGEDMGSTYTNRQAVESAQKADTIIYSIYYADPRYGGNEGELRRMSEDTGGRVFHVGRKMNLDDIFTQIQEEVRSQYMLAYTPTNAAKDGTFRKIEIKPNNKDLKAQSRKGYYAMPPEN